MFFNRLAAIAACMIIFPMQSLQAQDANYKFGNVSVKDFDVLDDQASAVILYESGETHFIGNKHGWFSYVYTCTRRIKIRDKRAFDVATVEIGLYKKDEDAEVLSDLKAATYNLNNGAISTTKLAKDGVFSERLDKNHNLKKFTLPGVQEGSIIEYTYTITSNFVFNIPSWEFQHANFPAVWSEYEVSIPSALIYMSTRQGNDSFYIQKSWQGKQTYRVTQVADKNILGMQDRDLTVTAVTNNARWVKRNVPALKKEEYVSSLDNYVDKIEFQLSSVDNGEETTQVMNTWQSVCQELLKEDDFQQAASYDNPWISDLANVSAGETDINIAKKIYYYVQRNYVCTDSSTIFRYEDLSTVYKKQRGSVRGINLLLIAMLHHNGIEAKPVLLSTRDNGFVNPNYPILDRFNYLVCRVKLSNGVFLLDAALPYLGFGELSNKCYNGYARVMDALGGEAVFLSTDSLKETSQSSLFLSNSEPGKISGTYKCLMGKMQSMDLRAQMSKSNKEEYTKEIKQSFGSDVQVNNLVIDSLAEPGMPISLGYDLLFAADGDIFYMSPLIGGDVYHENPFKAAQRSYPVEMPYRLDKTYIFNMEVPAGYKVDELPKPVKITLNGNEGSFEYLIQQNGNTVQLRCITKLNRANFEREDYETLRNFFTVIVAKENEQIVFKKQ
jgi:hypothetical protein